MRHQRVTCSFFEEKHWHGLRAAGIQSAWNRNYGRNPRESGAGAHRFDAVLQAAEIDGADAVGSYEPFRVDVECLGIMLDQCNSVLR